LRLHQVHVDRHGFIKGLLYGIRGDFVEHHPEDGRFVRLLLGPQFFLQVPADGLAFAIRVSGQINGINALGRLLQLGNQLLLAFDHFTVICLTYLNWIPGCPEKWPGERTLLPHLDEVLSGKLPDQARHFQVKECADQLR
jgi:hypothetical protein